MNEKIQQLVKQANREIGEQLEQPGVYLDFGPAKYFAELIIKECADYANWYQANSRYTDIAKAIKEHFGLK